MKTLHIRLKGNLTEKLSSLDADNLLVASEAALDVMVRELTGPTPYLRMENVLSRVDFSAELLLSVNEVLTFTRGDLLDIYLEEMAWGPALLSENTLDFEWQAAATFPPVVRVAHLGVAMGFAPHTSVALIHAFAQQIVQDHLRRLTVPHHCYKIRILAHEDETEAHVFAYLCVNALELTQNQDVEYGEQKLEVALLEQARKLDRTAEVAINIWPFIFPNE